MSSTSDRALIEADDVAMAAAVFALDPAAIGGAILRAPYGPVRERWLAFVREHLPFATPWCPMPISIGAGRLLGGLDLAATLKAGRPMVERGLLATADGGVIVLAMAERAEPANLAYLTAAMDRGEVALERDGIASRLAARFGVIALDEGIGDDEHTAPGLRDRLALYLNLANVSPGALDEALQRVGQIDLAGARARAVTANAELQAALCGAAIALGVDSLRCDLLALRVAAAAAALSGRDVIDEADVALAARLVLAPRATRLPAQAESDQDQGESSRPADDTAQSSNPPETDQLGAARRMQEVVLEATRAFLPAQLLAALATSPKHRAPAATQGRSGACRSNARHGRPLGARPGKPRISGRLNLIETLRAAAPWQPVRHRRLAVPAQPREERARVIVLPEDYRVTRFAQQVGMTTIFLVDASGSSAMHRLAEVKGAVELLLAQCYVRRDKVALIGFRNQAAEVLLAPTRSLTRARRSLAALPGGGATPLAAGLMQGRALAQAVRRRGETPLLVLMTDARANIACDGEADPVRAERDAWQAARELRNAGCTVILIDTSPRPRPVGQRLALELGARYVPLPHADATALSQVVQGMSAGVDRGATGARRMHQPRDS